MKDIDKTKLLTKVIFNEYEIPVFATKGTIEGIKESDKKQEMLSVDFNVIKAEMHNR